MLRIDSWVHWGWSALLCVALGCTVPGPDAIFPIKDASTDTSDNTFPTELQTIIAARCSGSGCHTGGSSAGGLDLTAGQEITNMVGVSAVTNPNATLVVAGAPNDSYLIWRLRALQGTTLMPPPYASQPEALEESEIVLFEQWITGLAATPPTNDIIEPEDIVEPEDIIESTDLGVETLEDTGTVQSSVAEIFVQYCNNCHVGENPFIAPNLNAGVYEENLINVPSAGAPATLLVQPGDAENSMLIWRLEGTNNQTLMPPGNQKIPDQDIETIKAWIDGLASGGAP